MNTTWEQQTNRHITRFHRDFYAETDEFTYIGDGELGGKAAGLAFIKEKIVSYFAENPFPPIHVQIPRLTVITTQFFDLFMKQNNLYDMAYSDSSDERIAYHFIKAELPANLIGDLWGLIAKVHLPLAIRSSSLLEDSLKEPFAGIYETKMIPNNQPDAETRFKKLTEAIKFVYASTFFQAAKSYMKATRHNIEDEKMAIIIQEVVGSLHNNRFYPTISGVGRSYNFYPTGHAEPADGVVDLALGLGKTIVDGGSVWTYCPKYPEVAPPYSSINALMKQTQLSFWAVNMGKAPAYDPIKETEYLEKLSLKDAEYDNTLNYIASTYDYISDRLNIGTGYPGPRVINFSPLLLANLLPVNELVETLLALCEKTFQAKVEIEFAISMESSPQGRPQVRFGFLQVRPMAVSQELIVIQEELLTPEKVLATSDNVMGNGCLDNLYDIVYVNPETFQMKNSKLIASELELINRQLLETKTPYLLIGFGRWGSSDPWLGIPVNWGQISGARAIIEAQLPGVTVDFSQGSHFFHNMSNLGILYFSIKYNAALPIDWQWLNQLPVSHEWQHVKHVRLNKPLSIQVDGRQRKGVIFK